MRHGRVKCALAAACCLLFGGCYIVGLNGPPRRGYAHVTVPRLADGKVAVYVFGTHSRPDFIEQRIPKERRGGLTAFSLSPRVHLLEIECQRPNAWVAVHGGIDFEMTVEPDTNYVLDCAPGSDFDNHFSLTRVEPQEAGKEPPLEIGPWLGCYDVTADRADAHVRLGRLRLTDHLEPATAGTYTVETVKEGERPLTMMGWWPMSPTSVHLGLGDGFTGWGGELEQTSVGLQGSAGWSADTGEKNGGWILRASRAACDP